MKILVCTDGSQQSIKAIEEAVKMAVGCNATEVAVIHVIEKNSELSTWEDGYPLKKSDMDRFLELENHKKEEREKILSRAVEIFKNNNVTASAILKNGHPAETIANVASEDGYDLVVIGSRGLGGLKKILLGSVSNSIVQEVKANVLVVK